MSPSCRLPIRLLFYLSFNKCIVRKVIFSTDMSYKRHILSFGSHWGTEMHVLNIFKNVFHSIPRQWLLYLWLETKHTENALHNDVATLGWITGRQDNSFNLGKISCSWQLKSRAQFFYGSSLRCAQWKAFWEGKVWLVQMSGRFFSWKHLSGTVEHKAKVGEFASPTLNVQRAEKAPLPWFERGGPIWEHVEISGFVWKNRLMCWSMGWIKWV